MICSWGALDDYSNAARSWNVDVELMPFLNLILFYFKTIAKSSVQMPPLVM